jgi:hypothetical protein
MSDERPEIKPRMTRMTRIKKTESVQSVVKTGDVEQ